MDLTYIHCSKRSCSLWAEGFVSKISPGSSRTDWEVSAAVFQCCRASEGVRNHPLTVEEGNEPCEPKPSRDPGKPVPPPAAKVISSSRFPSQSPNSRGSLGRTTELELCCCCGLVVVPFHFGVSDGAVR